MSERQSRKAIAIPPKPGAEQWVRQGAEPPPPAPVKLKRLTLDLPEALHRAIKLRAVHDGISIVEMLRGLLEREYGAPR
jgi:hypothetical protein